MQSQRWSPLYKPGGDGYSSIAANVVPPYQFYFASIYASVKTNYIPNVQESDTTGDAMKNQKPGT